MVFGGATLTVWLPGCRLRCPWKAGRGYQGMRLWREPVRRLLQSPMRRAAMLNWCTGCNRRTKRALRPSSWRAAMQSYRLLPYSLHLHSLCQNRAPYRELTQPPNIEICFYCPQALLGLDFHSCKNIDVLGSKRDGTERWERERWQCLVNQPKLKRFYPAVQRNHLILKHKENPNWKLKILIEILIENIYPAAQRKPYLCLTLEQDTCWVHKRANKQTNEWMYDWISNEMNAPFCSL